MAIIQSNKCLLQLDRDGTYVTIMCIRNFSVNTITTEKEITAPVDGKFKSFDYSQLSARVNVDGVLIRDLTTNTMFDFAEAQLNFLELKVRAVFIDEIGQPKVFTALCIVTNANIDASAGQIGSGTAELLASGEYKIENALPQTVNLRILLFGNPSVQAFFKFQLIDTNGTAIFQSDILPQANGGNLANPIDITVPVPKGSWYYWFQMDTNAIGNVFSLNAPPTKSSTFNSGIYNETSNGVQLYDFNSDREVSVEIGTNAPPPTCVAPAIASGATLPDGQVGQTYSQNVVISGTQPFNVSNVVKPAWMNIALLNDTIVLSGVPDVAGTGVQVSFDVTNACGTTSLFDTIDIAAAPITAVTMQYFHTVARPGILRIYVNSVLVIDSSIGESGEFTVNAGDVIEAQCLGINVIGVTNLRKLYVVNVTDTIIMYDVDNSPTNLTFTWTTAASKTYFVRAETHS